MQKIRSFAAFRSLPWGLLTTGLLICGCDKSEQITKYTVPNHLSLQTPEFADQFERVHPKPQRMIAVVVPQKNVLWFFKLEGDIAAVSAREPDVKSFLQTVRFPQPQMPQWTLPTGWQQKPGDSMRYATLVLDGQPALEMSVTPLPAGEGPVEPQVVANINRWRNQMSLPGIDEADLDQRTEKLNLEAGTGYLMNVIGRPRARPQMPPAQKGPQGREANPHERVANPPERNANPPAQPDADAPKYEKPEEWTDAPSTGFSVVSLRAVDGEAKVAITVTPAKGNPLDNVNRWRSQVKLESLTAAQLPDAATKVAVGKLTGNLYAMTGEERTILGVIVEDRGQTWFIKLDGNSQLAERERPRFEEFLKSLQLQ